MTRDPTMRVVMTAYVTARDAGGGELMAVQAALRAFEKVAPGLPPLLARQRVLSLIAQARSKAPDWYWRNIAPVIQAYGRDHPNQ
ncbi:hypothetical protein [Marinivivus vitaminiproducens]|uniref:hypothetical protein n=1 Tax=Marinivivus vitaminiproducens TaxID=3035935 RepID=UPI0027AA90F0|nr:hypothetical protein P4R82_16720 [Geminicoccaceae bacterium SCSIO 64248]